MTRQLTEQQTKTMLVYSAV